MTVTNVCEASTFFRGYTDVGLYNRQSGVAELFKY